MEMWLLSSFSSSFSTRSWSSWFSRRSVSFSLTMAWNRPGCLQANMTARAIDSRSSSSTWPPVLLTNSLRVLNAPRGTESLCPSSASVQFSLLRAVTTEAMRPFVAGPSIVMAVQSSRSWLVIATLKSLPSEPAAESLNSLASLASMSSRLTRPSEHPQMTPTTLPNMCSRLTMDSLLCSSVKPGDGSPSFMAADSMAPPNVTPATSLQIWPQAAAAKVLRPRVTPRVRSIAFPAWIMTVLSMNPKPTMGTMLCTKCRRSCRADGSLDADASSRSAPRTCVLTARP
mmetsp:Transcript_24452/g.65279  ORF Transcript_24452/g.65279 Transcript_24452/m.65279 type:complete len:286 (-) Transcript_24452:46-903(-)